MILVQIDTFHAAFCSREEVIKYVHENGRCSVSDCNRRPRPPQGVEVRERARLSVASTRAKLRRNMVRLSARARLSQDRGPDVFSRRQSRARALLEVLARAGLFMGRQHIDESSAVQPPQLPQVMHESGFSLPSSLYVLARPREVLAGDRHSSLAQFKKTIAV